MMMKTKAVLLIVAMFAMSDDPKDASHVESAKHQGTWVATSMEREGTKTSEVIVSSITRTVDGDHVIWKRNGKSFAGTSVKLDPTTDPKTIDVTPDGGPNRDQPVLGIYKLDGDLLTICMADAKGERPKEFSSPKGSKRSLTTFRRLADVQKARPKK